MEKAKAAVGSFLSRDGKHDTEVHETVNPAVTNEHVAPTRHEKVTTAVDREVHQDHYHTSVQPIKDRQVLPEQHHHNVAGVQHKEIHHGNDSHVKDRLAAEKAQFKDTREVGETTHTTTANPVVGGEHVHHHIHETIQPVIQRETIEPHVVHTTIPVHEVHHHEPKHHTASALPAVTMEEFQRHNGALHGREKRSDHFDGEPKAVGGTLGGLGAKGTTSITDPEPRHGSTGHASHAAAGMTDPTTGTMNGQGTHAHGNGTHTTHDKHSPTTGTKPSLLQKLNPRVDADGDGKAGFMS